MSKMQSKDSKVLIILRDFLCFYGVHQWFYGKCMVFVKYKVSDEAKMILSEVS